MSETKKAEKAAEAKAEKVLDPEELVDYEAPLLPGKTKQEVVVIVNGERLAIKRGVRVQIKLKYRETLDAAARQQYAAYQLMNETRKQGETPAVKM